MTTPLRFVAPEVALAAAHAIPDREPSDDELRDLLIQADAALATAAASLAEHVLIHSDDPAACALASQVRVTSRLQRRLRRQIVNGGGC